MKSLELETRHDGVAIVTIDVPGSQVNVISRALLGEFRELLDAVERDPAVKAVVLASGKQDTFIAGADLREIETFRTEDEAKALVREAHELLDRLQGGTRPVVAAIHGAAFGGGLELALACHYRVATDDPVTVLSLPEVLVGLTPGAGGTQRLPRLIGLERALPMLLTGQRMRAQRAFRFGLVDAVTRPVDLLETAAKVAWSIAGGELPRHRRTTLKQRVMSLPPVRAFVFSKVRKATLRKTRGLYPAPPLILDAVEAGVADGYRAGQQKEIEAFGRLAVSPESRNLVRLFLASTELKKPTAGAPPRSVGHVAVVGAGLMGQGIASVSLPQARVTIRDVLEGALTRAVAGVEKTLEKRAASGAITDEERREQRERLAATNEMDAVAGADLVIEAVYEDLALKRRVIAEMEAVVSPEAVIASNTSAIPIGRIAEGALHPERIVGMHYFSPVPKMPLLEVVIAEKSADWAVSTARAFGIAQGKTVIVVRDGPGFYTTRAIGVFMSETMHVLDEGAEIVALDNALRSFGFPMGPAALLDAVGIDVASHVSRDLAEAFSDRGYKPSTSLIRISEAALRGRKSGKGFYVYPPDGGRKRVNESIYDFLGGRTRKALDPTEVVDRLTFQMLNEAAHCLGEGIIRSPTDGDVGGVLGLGFPPFRGGPFRYADTLGAAAVVKRLEVLAARYGKRFKPAPLLVGMAARGEKFYP